MSQPAATIESLPMAFALVKEMQADGLEWDEGYRPLGRRALAEIIERRIGRGVSDIGMPLTPERVWRAMNPDQISIGAGAGLPRIRSAAFSAIMIATALILPPTKSGITEASTTRSRSVPRTRIWPSTTESGSAPIRQVPLGWNTVPSELRMKASISSSVSTPGPGRTSSPRTGSKAGVRDRTVGQVGVALGGLDQGMAEQPGDGRHVDAVHGGDRGPAVPQVVKAHIEQPGLAADAPDRVMMILREARAPHKW